jgi:hypothetical protein
VLENIAHAPNTPESIAYEREVLDLLTAMNDANYTGGTKGVVDAIEGSHSCFLVSIQFSNVYHTTPNVFKVLDNFIGDSGDSRGEMDHNVAADEELPPLELVD